MKEPMSKSCVKVFSHANPITVAPDLAAQLYLPPAGRQGKKGPTRVCPPQSVSIAGHCFTHASLRFAFSRSVRRTPSAK
jgi:hypothetical protein